MQTENLETKNYAYGKRKRKIIKTLKILIRHKSVFAYTRFLEICKISLKTHLSKAVNAHDDFRGLYLLDVLGIAEPQEINKKKSPTFFYAI